VALIESVPRTATIRALEPGEAIVIDRASFQSAAAGQAGADLVSLIRGANVLKASPLFAELGPEAMATLLKRVQRIPMKKDQTVIRRGEVGEFFYVTLEGELEVMGPDDRTPVATLRKGDPFGEIALLANVPRTASVVARTDGSLLCLSREDFNQFFSEHLALGEKLEQLGTGRLAQLEEQPHA
jgi:CRP-like cAMP-binding protein